MEIRKNEKKLGTKIGISFGLVALILIGTIFFTLLRIHAVDKINNNLTNSLSPQINDYLKIMNGLSRSLSARRDYLLTNDNRYKLEDQAIWQSNIIPFLQDKPNINNDDAHTAIMTKLHQLDELQKKIDKQNDLTDKEKIHLFYESIIPVGLNLENLLTDTIQMKRSELLAGLQTARLQLTYLLITDAGFLFLGLVLCSLLGVILTKLITAPVKNLVKFGNNLAKGNLNQKIDLHEALEFEQLSESLNKVIDTLAHLADITEKISEGDYTSKVEVHSEQDRLAINANKMIDNFSAIINQANSIAAGNYQSEIKPRSSHDSLGLALQHMTEMLRKNHIYNEEQNWLKDGLTKFANVMREPENITALYNHLMTAICQHTGAMLGALYLLDTDEKHLVLQGSYAYKEQPRLTKSYELNEGFIGQVGYQKTPLTLEVPADESYLIDGVSEQIKGKYLYIFPLIFENSLIGVGILVWFKQPSRMIYQYMESLMPVLVGQVSTTQHQVITERLLHEQKTLSEKLSVQQQELTVINEELEQQTEDLKASEEELKIKDEQQRKINKELEERTIELEQQKSKMEKANIALKAATKELREKAEELTKASQYKSEFLANMSHELRTPLNSLLILARIFAENQDNNLNAEQVDSAKIMLKSGQDLLTIINDILDLAKAEAGKIDVYIAPASIRSIAEQLNSIFSIVTNEKGIKFYTEISSNVPEFFNTDGQKLVQILRNLISNAIKFTEEGFVKFSVYKPSRQSEMINLDPKQQYLAFSVMDTGIGIEDTKQKLVFESFQQADGTTSRKYGGTGLGLSISREFTKLLGGYITLESTPGKGSNFILYLPLTTSGEAEVKSVTPPVKETPILPVPKTTEIRSIKKLLIVEDDVNFANILMNICRKLGYHCRHAVTAEAALEILEKDLPDAILLDLVLPKMDGFGFLDKVKQNPKTCQIPVQVISSSDNGQATLTKGAIGYMTKPITREQLMTSLDAIKKITQKNIKSLLIVEDDPTLLEQIKRLMQKYECSIDTSMTGNKALELLKEKNYDCVILDLGLADISGEEILNQYFANYHEHNPAIIIYTGKELSIEQTTRLNQFADSIIFKSSSSSIDTLLQETSKFLKETEDNKQKIGDNPFPAFTSASTNILLVDDDSRNLFAVGKILKSRHYEVITANNGKKALEILNSTPNINLVLMDIMMPVMDGYETIKLIRETDNLKNIPIIALTAKALASDMEKCLDAGANDYLPKPIDTDQLIAKVIQWSPKK